MRVRQGFVNCTAGSALRYLRVLTL